MNYLAHLYFAEPTPAARVGSLMGDFFPGGLSGLQDPELARAIWQHRWIDVFTDQHPQIVALRSKMSSPHRRYAGVIIDFAFDHFLIHYWPRYSQQPLEDWLESVYRDLSRFDGAVPTKMQPMLQRLIERRWLASYADWHTLTYALERVSLRASKPDRLLAAAVLFDAHRAELEAVFVPFFDDLCGAIATGRWEAEYAEGSNWTGQ